MSLVSFWHLCGGLGARVDPQVIMLMRLNQIMERIYCGVTVCGWQAWKKRGDGSVKSIG